MNDLAHAFPPGSWLGRVLRWPLRLAPRGRAVPVLIGPARGLRWVVGVGLHGCWLGTYEWRKQARFAAAVTPGAVVYDIGANTGFYTLLAARRAGAGGVIHAFEPNPRNLAPLREHVRLNRPCPVTVHALALSDRAGALAFEDTGSFTGRLAQQGDLKVRAVPLDHLVNVERLAPPTLLKIDVEGAELSVLQGARDTLAQHRPMIFLATHGREIQAACRQLLADWGYRLAPLDPRQAPEAADEWIAR